MTIHFGIFKGRELEDIPHPYLFWVLGNCHRIHPELRRAIVEVLSPGSTGRVPMRTPEPQKAQAKRSCWATQAIEWHELASERECER